jgi:excisionase family DNA binding protein
MNEEPRNIKVEPLAWRVKQAGRLLQMSESSVYLGLRTGAIPGIKIGGRWRIPRAALEKIIASGSAADDGEVTPQASEARTE